MFGLHPQLEKDCIELGSFELCRCLLMNDANYPWIILVPERDDITEIYQLSENDQQLLLKESNFIAQLLKKYFYADKINIAALGNVVPQLHIHHIARYKDDPAWPAPVWGAYPAVAYTEDQLNKILDTVNLAMQETAAID